MRRILALALLLGGAMLASTDGARNGDAMTAWRRADAVVQTAQGLVDLEQQALRERAALRTLEQFDLAINPAGMPPDRAAELATALAVFDLHLTRADLDRARFVASEAVNASQAAYDRRSELLSATGFLGEAGVEDLLPRAHALDPRVVRDAVGDIPWSGVVLQAEAFALGAKKQKLYGSDGPTNEQDAALIALIDQALQGGERAPVLAELSRLGEPIERPEPALVRDELLTAQHRPNTLRALMKAGVLDTRQSPGAKHDLAVGERDSLGLPAPGARLRAWFERAGFGWLIGVAAIVAGALLARRQIAAENAGGGAGGSGRALAFPDALRTIDDAIQTIAAQIADLPMDQDHPAAREALDHLQSSVINPVVDERGQLQARHGVAAFAGYFSPFSSAERNLARAWSALTDGHAVVARQALEHAREGIAEARSAWAAVER